MSAVAFSRLCAACAMVAGLIVLPSGPLVAKDRDDQAEIPSEAAQTGQEIRPVRELRQPRAVTALALNRDGTRILTGGLDGAIRLWNPEAGILEGTVRLHEADVGDVAFLDGSEDALSVGVDGRMFRFDPRTGRVAAERQFGTPCLALTPINRTFAAVACADLSLQIVEVASLKTVRTLKLKGDVQYNTPSHLSTSADGAQLLVGDPFSTVDVASWEVSPARRLFSYNAILSPDGKLLLSGQIGRNAQIFALEPFAQVAELRAPMADTFMSSQGRVEASQDTPIYAVGWSANGRLAATGGLDRVVRLWDLAEIASPVELARLAGHQDVVTQLVFVSGSKLISSDLSGSILVWSLEAVTDNQLRNPISVSKIFGRPGSGGAAAKSGADRWAQDLRASGACPP